MPVSSSVRLSLYSVMMPFLSARAGGAQLRLMEEGLVANTLMFNGASEGAERR